MGGEGFMGSMSRSNIADDEECLWTEKNENRGEKADRRSGRTRRWVMRVLTQEILNRDDLCEGAGMSAWRACVRGWG